MSIRWRILVFPLALLALFGVSIDQTFAAIGGRPATPNSQNERSNSWFIYTVQPGATISDAVEIVNTSAESKRVSVYAADSLLAAGGAFSCDQKADPVDAAGSWLDLASPHVALAPGEVGRVNFAIRVPNNADVGEHSACIVIQEDNQTAVKTGNNIALNTRSAVRVYLTIPGDISKGLKVSGFTVDRNPLKPIIGLRPRVINTGNVSVDTKLDVRLRNLLGFSTYRNSGLYTVARGVESAWNFELKKPFWGGLYAASFSAAYDPDPTIQLGMANEDNPQTILRGPVIWFFSGPTPLGALAWALIIILLAMAYYFYRKHLAVARWIGENWVYHTVADGEELAPLAKKYKIDWHTLARANKLEAPYDLYIGQRILVPPPILSCVDEKKKPLKKKRK